MQHKWAYLLSGVVSTTVLSLDAAQAQQGPPPPAPVEIYACDFVDGKDMDDLRAVNAELNSWADGEGIDMFSSMATPVFHSPDDAYDVYFLDAWSDGAALGAGYSRYYSQSGARIEAAYGAVVECESHAYYSGIMVVPPAEGRNGGPLQFQDCTLLENRSLGDAIEAITAFSGGAGPKLGGFAVLLPFVGQPRDITYDFKLVAIFDSFQTMGNAFDAMFKGGGGQQANSTVGSTMTCDTPRMYNQVVIRQMKEP